MQELAVSDVDSDMAGAVLVGVFQDENIARFHALKGNGIAPFQPGSSGGVSCWRFFAGTADHVSDPAGALFSRAAPVMPAVPSHCLADDAGNPQVCEWSKTISAVNPVMSIHPAVSIFIQQASRGTGRSGKQHQQRQCCQQDGSGNELRQVHDEKRGGLEPGADGETGSSKNEDYPDGFGDFHKIRILEVICALFKM